MTDPIPTWAMEKAREIAKRFGRHLTIGDGDVIAEYAKALATERTRAERLHDLVRHQRGALHDADLITDEEYAVLAGDHAAVARLEGYDALRDQLAAANMAHTRLRAAYAMLEGERDALRTRAESAERERDEAVRAFHLSDPVIETGESGMKGERGVIVESVSDPGALSVRWNASDRLPPGLQTGITHGTRLDVETLRRERDEARRGLAGVVADLRERRDFFRNVALFHRGRGRRYQATMYGARADGINDVFERANKGPSTTALTRLLAEAEERGRVAMREEAAKVAVQAVVCFGEDFRVNRQEMQNDYRRDGRNEAANALGMFHARMQGIIEDRAADVAAEIRILPTTPTPDPKP